jgi:hypothetical protein
MGKNNYFEEFLLQRCSYIDFFTSPPSQLVSELFISYFLSLVDRT